MLVKSSFSVSLKKPLRLANNKGFKLVKYYFQDWRDQDQESDLDFKIRILSSKGLNIKDCNHAAVFNN
jgi:hypothetical protein